MINNKKDLCFYITADRIMNGYPKRRSIKEILINLVDCPITGVIINYLRAMRKYAYYRNTAKSRFSISMIMVLYWHRRWNRLSRKLGYSIGPNSLGYGVVLPHHGTIVVNENSVIGNFAVLHTCTCIAGGNKTIGDFLYLSTGSQIVGELTLGGGVTVAAHSLVNKSFEGNCLLAGAPAMEKHSDYPLWQIRDGEKYVRRIEQVMELKKKIYG